MCIKNLKLTGKIKITFSVIENDEFYRESDAICPT